MGCSLSAAEAAGAPSLADLVTLYWGHLDALLCWGGGNYQPFRKGRTEKKKTKNSRNKQEPFLLSLVVFQCFINLNNLKWIQNILPAICMMVTGTVSDLKGGCRDPTCTRQRENLSWNKPVSKRRVCQQKSSRVSAGLAFAVVNCFQPAMCLRIIMHFFFF